MTPTELDHLRSAWQPIETAPEVFYLSAEDRTYRLLLGHPEWCEPVIGFRAEAGEPWQTWDEDSDTGWGVFKVQPTHWMPLPPLPAPPSEEWITPPRIWQGNDGKIHGLD